MLCGEIEGEAGDWVHMTCADPSGDPVTGDTVMVVAHGMHGKRQCTLSLCEFHIEGIDGM